MAASSLPTASSNSDEIVKVLFDGAGKDSVSGEAAAYCDDRSGSVIGIGPNCNTQKEEGSLDIAKCYYDEGLKCIKTFAQATQICCEKLSQALMAGTSTAAAEACQTAAKTAFDDCKKDFQDKCECKRCVFTITKPNPPQTNTNTNTPETDDSDTPQDQEESADPNKRSVRTNSNYGIIPRVFGRYVVGGNIIWIGEQTATAIEYTRNNSKGEPRTINDVVTTVDFLAGISVGALDSIVRVWFNDVLIYNAGMTTDGAGNAEITASDPAATDLDLSVLTDGDYALERLEAFRPQVRMYRGTPGEHVIQALADKEGFGRVPANRNLATVYFSSIDVALFGGTFPEIRFDVVSIAPTTAAPRIVSGTVTMDMDHLEVDHRTGMITTLDGDDIHLINYDTLVEAYAPPSFSAGIVDVINMKSGRVYSVDGFVEDVFNPYFGHLDDRTVTTPEITRASRSTIYSDASSIQYDVVALVAADSSVGLRTYNHSSRETVTGTVASIGAVDEGDSVITSVDGVLRMYQFVMPSVNQTELTIRAFEILTPATEYNFSVPNTDIWGSGTTASVLQVIFDATDNSFVVFILAGSSYWMVKIATDGSVTWVAESPYDFPTTYSIGEHRSILPSPYYYFVNDADEVVEVTLSTGDVVLHSTLSAESLPSLGGAQYYDGRTQSVLYVTNDSRLARFFLNRITPVDISLKQVLDTLAEQISLPYGYLDTTDLADVYLKGYMIEQKTPLKDILTSLGEFYQFTSIDTGARFVLTKETTLASTITLDPADDFIAASYKVSRLLTANLIDGATVKFSGIDDKGLTELYQTVSVKADSDTQKVPVSVDYSLNIYDDAESMRINLERLVARKRADATVLQGEVMPRHMGLTLRDRVVVDGQTFMVRQQLLAPGLNSVIEGTELDQSVVDTAAALEAVSLSTGLTVVRAVPAQPYVPVVLFTNAITDADAMRATAGQQVVYTLIESPTADLEGALSFSFRSLAVEDQIVRTDPLVSSVDFTGTPPTSVGNSITITDTNSPTYTTGKHTKGAHAGYLDTPPLTNNDNPFTTNPDDMLIVVFDRADTAAALGDNVAAPYYSILETPTTNLLIVGREYIQYGSYDVDIDGVTVTFSNLFRGLFGTEPYTAHDADERVYLYTADTIKTTAVEPKYFKRGQNVKTFFADAAVAGVPSVFYHSIGSAGSARPWAPSLHDWNSFGGSTVRTKLFRRRPLVVDLLENLGTLPNDWGSLDFAYKVYTSEPSIATVEADMCVVQTSELTTITAADGTATSLFFPLAVPPDVAYWIVVCHLSYDGDGQFVVGHPAIVHVPTGYTTTYNDT